MMSLPHSNKDGSLNTKVDSPVFWQNIAPKLSITSNTQSSPINASQSDLQSMSKTLIEQGYVHLVGPGLDAPMKDLNNAVDTIVAAGLPPVFAFVYDEMWLLSTQLRLVLSQFLGESYCQLPDFWCWSVAPSESGWGPHRDKGASSLFPNKHPKSLTVWIPLTISHPLNGCMYILPADRDQYYGTNNQPPNTLPGSLTDIRALPADAGDVFFWSQHVWHWGSHAADNHDLPPRQSVAFEYQRGDITPFNQPLLNPHSLPSFEERLALIAKQILQYTHMYNFTDELNQIALALQAAYKLPDTVR